MKNENKHIWQFSRIGGVNRVCLESGSDLYHLDQLDQKLWTALSCPVNGLEIDPKTLSLIDTDQDGKIRVPEVLGAVKWILSLIKDANSLLGRNKSMRLAEIDTTTPLGKILYASSKQLLSNIGQPGSETITVEEASDRSAIFENSLFNGDGIITEATTDDESLKLLIRQIVACEGAEIDLSGQEGIGKEKIETFFTHCEGWLNWYQQAENDKKTILPFDDRTEAAYAAFEKVRSKIDDYFLRCQLAEFDPQTIETLNAINERIGIITNKELPGCIDEIASFPLARIEAKKALSFSSGINPAWKADIQIFRELISPVGKKLKQELSENEWKEIIDQLEVYQNWKSSKVGVEVETLGAETIETILAENRKEELYSLIDEDLKLEEETKNIILVEQMVRYHRDLFTLLNNFVTFSDFYRPGSRAIFQAGSLYFDQRCCDLCIKVSDMPKHGSMAAASGICLVYCDCFSKTRNEKMTIVAAFTDGDVDNLVVGRNAIFYDNAGVDWDATIIKIIDNPISIRQAFWSPYRKFSQFISKQAEKFAASKDQEIYKAGTSKVEQTSVQLASEQAKPAPFDIAKFAGIFAAIGLAIGAIGGFLAAAAKGFFSLKYYEMPLALLGVMLVISGPSMFLAWLKLRKRNLAPLLDANGWAVNARATINIVFGATLTHLAKLPKNSNLNFIDPYKKKSHPWLTTFIVLFIVVLALYLLWRIGLLEKWGIVPDLSPKIGTETIK